VSADPGRGGEHAPAAQPGRRRGSAGFGRLSALAVVALVVLVVQTGWVVARPPRSPMSAAVMPAAALPGAAVPADAVGDPDADAAGRVIEANMPDPSVLHVGDTYFLYATQGAGRNVQTATSADLRTWTAGPDALPVLGGWARSGRTWAPEVLATSAGYALFYSAVDRFSGLQCIGRAVAGDPTGPFVDGSTTPLVCQRSSGGSIDPDPVAADGRITLYWKNDGNCCGLPVRLWGQRMDAAAQQLIGDPVALLGPSAPWQGALIEAPEMFLHAGRYYLFYAANAFDSSRYAEGVATCTTPLGPCTDGPGPILTTTADAIGPGHAFVLEVAGKTVMVFHAWSPDPLRLRPPQRWVWIEPVSWVADAPVVAWPPRPAGPVEALGPPG
jgi:hypothetical protein